MSIIFVDWWIKEESPACYRVRPLEAPESVETKPVGSGVVLSSHVGAIFAVSQAFN